MKYFAQYLPFLFALIILPEEREAFVVTPWQHNKLRYPAPHSGPLFDAYRDGLTPPGGDDDRLDSYEWDDERQQQQPFSPIEQEPRSVNGSYRVDAPGSAYSNGVPQQGYHKTAPYDNGFHPTGESYSDPWSGSAPVNIGHGGKSVYRERTNAVSSAHNRKGPPAGSFAPPPMRMNSGGYRTHESAHNGRDVRPWNSQRRIDHSYADNLPPRPPHLGDASLSKRFRYQDPIYEPEAPPIEDEYLDDFDYPPQETSRYQPYQTFELPAQPAEPVTASYFAPETPDPLNVESDMTNPPVSNSALSHQHANGVPSPNGMTVKANGSFDHWQSVQKANGASYNAQNEDNIPTARNNVAATTVVVSVSNGVQSPLITNGASSVKQNDVGATSPGSASFPDTLNGTPSPAGGPGVTTDQESLPGMGVPTANPPIANGASAVNQNDITTPTGVSSFPDTVNGTPSPDNAASGVNDGLQVSASGTSAPINYGAMDVKKNDAAAAAPGLASFADTLNGMPPPVGSSAELQAEAPESTPFPETSMVASSTADVLNINNEQVSVPQAGSEVGSSSTTLKNVPSNNGVSVPKQDGSVPEASASGAGPLTGSSTTVPPTPTIGAARIERRDMEPRTQQSEIVPETRSVADSISRSPPAAATSPGVEGDTISQVAMSEKSEISSFGDTLNGIPSAATVSSPVEATTVQQPAVPGVGSFADNTDAVSLSNEASGAVEDQSVVNISKPAMNPIANGVAEAYRPKNGESADTTQSSVMQEGTTPLAMDDLTEGDEMAVPDVEPIVDSSSSAELEAKTTNPVVADSLDDTISSNAISDAKRHRPSADVVNGAAPTSENSNSKTNESGSKKSAQEMVNFIEGLGSPSKKDTISAQKDTAVFESTLPETQTTNSEQEGLNDLVSEGDRSNPKNGNVPKKKEAVPSGVGSFLGRSGDGLKKTNVSKPEAPTLNKQSSTASKNVKMTTTGESRAKKKHGAAAKNPVQAAAEGMSSFLSSFAGKPKRGGSETKKTALKPTPPKTPPPGLGKVVSPRSTSVSAVAKSTDDAKTSDMVNQDDTAKETKTKPKPASLSDVLPASEDNDDELTLEERIAATISNAKEISVSASKRTFESTRENLEDFKSRTQSRLDNSLSKREEAEKKLADIKARMEAEAREVEEQLAKELAETQAEIDLEVAQIMNLFATEKTLELQREENMVQLMDSLEEFIAAKEYDIAKEKNITKEVMEVRSKLKDGTIADNLDNLVEQKLSAVIVEQELVNDLFEFLIDLQDLTDESRERASRITQILDEFHQPDTESSTPYDWKDIEDMELVLEQAAENVKVAEERIREISQRIDNAFVTRAMVLGEDVPAGLAKTAQRAAGRSAKRAESYPELDLELDVENFIELKSKDEKELFGLLAKSVGSATFDGSKAAAYGIKAIVDTVTGKPAAEAASQIAKVRKQQELKKDSGSAMESSDAKKNKVAETVKSTASVLGSVGKAGTTIAKGIAETDSAQVAGEALKDTTKDLVTSLETAAALGAKLYNSTVNRMEERKDKKDPP